MFESNDEVKPLLGGGHKEDKAFKTMQAFNENPGPKKHFRSRRSTSHMLHLDSVQVQNTYMRSSFPSKDAISSSVDLNVVEPATDHNMLYYQTPKVGQEHYKKSLQFDKNQQLNASPLLGRQQKTYMKVQQIVTNKKSDTGQQAAKLVAAQSAKNNQLINKMRLKPSQILEEAKKDISLFGSRATKNNQARQGANSLAVLQGYLRDSIQQNQSQSSVLESGATETVHHTTIKAAINDKFIVKEIERFNQNHKHKASYDDIFETNLLLRGVPSIVKFSQLETENKSTPQPQFQSIGSLQSSVIDTNNQAASVQKPSNQESLFKSPTLHKRHQSLFSSLVNNNSSQAKSKLSKMHNTVFQQQQPWIRATNVLIKDDQGANKQQRYVPRLTEVIDIEVPEILGHYPSQKLFPLGHGGVPPRADMSGDNDSNSMSVDNNSQDRTSYQVQLMNVSQSQKVLPERPAPVGARERQQRIVSKIKLINNIKNEAKSKSTLAMRSKADDKPHDKSTDGSLSPWRIEQLVSERVEGANLYRGSQVLKQVVKPAQQKTLIFPPKAHKILRRAMTELDQVDLVNNDQVPLSRPRIRAILKRMKDGIELVQFGDEVTSAQKDAKLKTKAEKIESRGSQESQRLLQDIGRQAECELFGMLLKEKESKRQKKARNDQLNQLYDERMQRKRAEYERLKARQEQRQSLLQDKAYVSDDSSSYNLNDSFEFEQIAEYGNDVIQSARHKDMALHPSLLSSDRPSSANSDGYRHGVDRDRLTRMREVTDRKQQKQKKMILQELLNLLERPHKNSSHQAGNFYNKFRNIDKIIEQEKNDRIVTASYDEDLKRHNLQQNQKKIEALLKIPVHKKIFEPAQHHSDDESRQSSSIAQKRAIGKDAREANKSPIVEYLKQVQKDKILPHFMPFKHLQEATSKFGGGSGLKYKLDSFIISSLKAPSIAIAIKNIQGLRSMSLVDCRLGEEAFLTILKSTPQTLLSMNLSQNEHLTPKCYTALHKFGSLANLTLENCGIGDEILALLLDLDPLKLNPEPIELLNKSISPSRGLKKNKSQAIVEGDEDEFLLSGLVTSLRLFNVSKNRISDTGASTIARFLDKSVKLETLLLHWNKIRAKGAMSLAKAVGNNTTIAVLDLSFNSFGSGGNHRVVVSQDPKKEDDISIDQRHQLEKFECAESAWKWRKTFIKNRALLHVDISFNGFVSEDMMAIGDGLRENHSIIGCHIEGNGANLDALGFVCPSINKKAQVTKNQQRERGKQLYSVHEYDRIPVTMENEHLPMKQITQKREETNKNLSAGPISGSDQTGFASQVVPRNCWLCERWREQKFEVRLPEKYIGSDVQSVYIHLSFEDYKPMVMTESFEDTVEEKLEQHKKKRNKLVFQHGKHPTKNIEDPLLLNKLAGMIKEKKITEIGKIRPKAQAFKLYRMVPPTRTGIKYYFSLQNPKNFKKETFIDFKQQKIFLEDENKSLTNRGAKDNLHFSDESEDLFDAFSQMIQPKFVNLTKIIKPASQVLERNRLHATPRTAFQTQELTRPKSPWSLPKSFFGKYAFDDQNTLAKCFDFDWNCSSLPRMLKDPIQREEIIKFLKPRYGLFREAYKHLACLAPAGNVPSLGTNVLSDIMLRCGDFVDYKLLKLSDVDLAFIATNANGNKQFPFKAEVVINPERQLIRFQFFEVLIRLALERFQQKLKMSALEGIKVFYDQFIYETLSRYQSHPWRIQRYWNEECDGVIKENMDTLKEIFNIFAEAQSPGDPKVLRLSRLIDLITMSGVCDDTFGAREIGPLYNLSMQTNINEIDSTRHMDMVFLEFVECLARIADKTMHQNTIDFPQSPQKDSIMVKHSTTIKKKVMSRKHTMSFDDNATPQVQQGRQTDPVYNYVIQEHSNSRKQSRGSLPIGVPKIISTIDNNSYESSQRDNEICMSVAGISQSNDKGLDMAYHTGQSWNKAVGVPQSASKPSTSQQPKGARVNLNQARIRSKRSNFKRSDRSRMSSASPISRSELESRSGGDDMSAQEVACELHLSEKLQKYTNRIVMTCTSQAFSTKYMREYTRKNQKNAKRLIGLAAHAIAQAEFVEQSGYKASLLKLRFSDQKPPPTPKDKKLKRK